MQLVTRAGWGARAPKGTTGIASPVGHGVHWEGPRMGTFPHESCAAKVRGIQRFHMDARGWADIAYNALVCPHGVVYEGRGPGRRSAANGTNDGNARYYAVCYLSGEGDPFTDAARQGYLDAFAWLRAGGERRPHRSFKATACPGNEITAWINAGLPGPGTPAPVPPPAPPPGGHAHGTPMVRNRFVDGAWRGQVWHPERNMWFTQSAATGPWWEIRDVQQHLRDQGHQIDVDGWGGPSTNHHIVAYQRHRGLQPDGVVGPATWARLHGG